MIWLSLLALAIVGLYLALMFALALFVGRMLRAAREYDAAYALASESFERRATRVSLYPDQAATVEPSTEDEGKLTREQESSA